MTIITITSEFGTVWKNLEEFGRVWNSLGEFWRDVPSFQEFEVEKRFLLQFTMGVLQFTTAFCV